MLLWTPGFVRSYGCWEEGRALMVSSGRVLQFTCGPRARVAAPGRTSMLWGCSMVSSHLWAKTAVKHLQRAWDAAAAAAAAADGFDTRMQLSKMFCNVVKNNFVRFSLGSALRSSCIQDVPLSWIDVSLHNTTAFRLLLLFRLRDNSHQALTFLGLSLVSRRRRYFKK